MQEKPYTAGWEIGDPLHAMYAQHAARAQAEGFKQMPYGRYRALHEVLYWGVGEGA